MPGMDEIISKLSQDPIHKPVLLQPILNDFSSVSAHRYWDGTFGRGGHYRALKTLFPRLKTVAFDQDTAAIENGLLQFPTEVQQEELQLVHANFSHFSKAKWGTFDIMLLDLGVSSPQLDEPSRGFSFYHAGPLDMRMNPQQEVTAETIVNTFSEEELIRLFQTWGEIHRPQRVVRALVHDRKTKAFQNTLDLAGLIERVDGWRKKGQHPATLYFQALRLAVNNELPALEQVLPEAMEALNPGGKLAVISFHSLEDRIVKWTFKNSKLGEQTHKKVIEATDEEIKNNPRARSAKLRIFQRNVQDEHNQALPP